jgi:acetyl/propionyl-CoA carboxylase alpha subunit
VYSVCVQLAGEAYHLGGSEASSSYLNIDALMKACKVTNADALHPGYGFLSENPLLAEACATHNVVFIGPSPAAIRSMGSKVGCLTVSELSQ